AGDDPAVAQRVLRLDGGGDHGRPDRGHRADPAVPAGAVRGLVPGQAGRGDGLTAGRCSRSNAAASATPRVRPHEAPFSPGEGNPGALRLPGLRILAYRPPAPSSRPITNHQSPITNHESRITNHESRITNPRATAPRTPAPPATACARHARRNRAAVKAARPGPAAPAPARRAWSAAARSRPGRPRPAS